jgi:hypothetical protein
MHTIPLLVALALASDPVNTTIYAIKKDDAGKLPGGWKADRAGEGKGSEWKVVADKTAPSKGGYVLAQTAKGPSRLFNLCVLEKSSFTDGEVSVRIKAVAGKIDQGGGVVWRYQDAKNYYVCRYNPLEDNLRVYKVIDGRRVQLGTEEKLVREKGKWFTLSIAHKGDAITCSLDGKKYLEVKDGAIKKAGKVGLWSKADARSHFDELTVKER